MVMHVFTLPSYDVVFKVIKDRFDLPKDTTPNEVMRRYKLVFEHDRAGRLVEAHEFEHLRIPRNRFEPALLEDLLCAAGQMVRLEGDDVVIAHAYVERRIRPLNIFFAEADATQSAAAARDYGQAIKDLAVSNIFPGDVLTKNFGVTRRGRGRLLRLRRALFSNRLQFSRSAAGHHVRGRNIGRAVVLRARE